MRRTLIIEIECESVSDDGSDFWLSLAEVARKVLEGYTSGFDRNDKESYRYRITDTVTPADLE